jgi:hypothetical protein
MGRKPYTDLEKTLMCELAKVTNNILYVAKVTGASTMTVTTFLKDKGIVLHAKDKIFVRDTVTAEHYNRVMEGETLTDLSEETGKTNHLLSARFMYYSKKFNKNKVNAGKNNTAKKDKEAELWVDLINNKEKTMTQIASEEGLSLSGVSRRVKRYLNRNNSENDFRHKQEINN